MRSKALTTIQASKATGVSRASIQAWMAAGRLRGPKLQIQGGKAVRLWTESDLRHLRKIKQQSKLGHPKKKA
jgi:hypothetical protein